MKSIKQDAFRNSLRRIMPFLLLFAAPAWADIALNSQFTAPPNYTPGSTGTWTLTIQNTGDTAETDLDVSTAFPAGATVTAASCSTVGTGSVCDDDLTGGELTSTGNEIAPGGSISFSLTLSYTASLALDPLQATATVTSSVPAQSSAPTASSTLRRVSDISVTKTSPSTSYTPGESGSFTVTIRNAGPSNAPGLTLTDTAPAGMTIGNWSCTPQAQCPVNSGSGNLSQALSLNAGVTLTYTLPVSFASSASANPLVNTASVTVPASLNDPDDADQAASVSLTRDAQVDLSVAFPATGLPDSYIPGTDDETISFTVANSGPSDAIDAALALDWTSAVSAVSWSCAPTSACTPSSGTADIAATVDLAAGASVVVNATLDFDPGARADLLLEPQITAASSETDTDADNDSDSLTLTADRRADVRVTKTAVATVNPGASFVYEILVENLGPGNLGPVPGDPSTVEERGVLLTDLFPASLLGDLDQCTNAELPCWTVCANDLATVGDYDPDNCPTTPVQGSGSINDRSLALAAGSSTLLRAFVRTSGSASGELINRASVRLDPGPPVLVQGFTSGGGSDFSEVTTAIELASDIRVVKTDSTATAVAGTEHSYVIEVINDGFIQANNVGLSDSLPLFVEAAFPGQADNAGFRPGTIGWQCEAFNGACCDSGGSNCGIGTPLVQPTGVDILAAGVDLPGQSRVRFTVTGKLDPRATGTLVNEAILSVPGDIGDPNLANNRSTDDDTAVVAQADLRINKRLLPLDEDDLLPPFSLVYLIEVENLGPSFAAGATVTDALSSDALDNSTADWACTAVVNPSGQTRCVDSSGTGPLLAAVDLESGGKVEFRLEVDTTAAPLGQVRNDASVAFGSTVATDFAVSSLIGQTRLVVDTDDSRSEIAPGEVIDYTVRVENLGPDDVFGATVSDLFPQQIDSLTWSCEAITPIPGDLDFLQLSGEVDTAGDGLVVSPDGRHVYVIGTEADSLFAFDRNSTPGLNFGEVVLLETEIDGINEASDPGPAVNGLDGPLDIAISPDGFYVYALSNPSVDSIADFTGQFEIVRWSSTTQAFGCGSSSVTSSFNEVSLATANGCAAIFAGFTHAGADQAGTVSFNWSVTQSQPHLYVARFGIDGETLETLTTNQPASGTGTIRVETGEQLRFTVSKSSGFGISTLMITDFEFTPDAESPPTLTAFSRSANPAAPDFGRLTFLGSVSDGLPLAPREMTLTADRIYVAGIGSAADGQAPNIAIFNRLGVSGVPTFDAIHTDGVPAALASVVAEPGGEWLFAGGESLAMFSINPAAPPVPAGRLSLVDTFDAVDDRIGSLTLAGTAPQLYGRTRVGAAGRLVMISYLDANGDPLLDRRFTYSAADMVLEAGVTDPLTGIGRIDVAPDGEHLAGVSRDENTVYTFRRDTISGGLSFAEAFTADQPIAGNNRGLVGAADVQFAADGRHLLIAASAFGSGTNPPLTVYNRRAPEPLFAFLEADRQGDPGINLLRAPNDVAISSDGAHVYSVSLADNALLRFDRFPRAGLAEGTLGQHLQFVEAWTQGVDGVDGLNEPRRVLVSPNGRSVYVSSELGNSIAVFDRNNDADSPDFGDLHFRQRVVNGSGGVTGLAGAQGMAMDPASRHLYVAGSFAGSIVRFTRNVDGSLSFAERVVSGSDGVTGMTGIRDLAVSGDGRQLFGVSTQSNALVVFNREADDGSDDYGRLTFVQAQVSSIGVRPMAVALAPDGAHVYVVGQNSNTLAALRRVTNPASSAFGQVQPIQLLTSGSDGIAFMNGPRDVAVSPDGKRIYVAAEFSNAVLVFDRDTNANGSRYGVPSLVEIRRNTVGGVDGLRQARAVAVSNDSRNVYAAGFGSGALASFRLGVGSLCTVAGSGNINDQVDIGVGGTILYRATGVVRPDARAPLFNLAAVQLPENFQVDGAPDPDCPADFQFCDSDTTTLVPRGSLSIDKTSDQVSVTAGEMATYTVTIGNAGPSSLEHEAGFPLTLSDPLDTNPAFVPGSATWSCVAEGSGGLDRIQSWLDLDPENISSGPFNRLQGLTGLARVPTATGSWLATTSVVDDSVSLFSRDPFSGVLLDQASVQSGEMLSGQLVDSLDGAQAIYASSDGRFLYVASRVSDSVTVLSVDEDSNGKPVLGLVEIVRGLVGLNQALAIVASPDENFLYVAGGNDDAIVIFERDPIFGTLDLVGPPVLQGVGGVDGLTDVNQLVLSPDGEHLYALSPTVASVTLFDRDPVDGTLTWRQTWTELDFAVELDGLSDGRFDPPVGLDPGGRHLYLAAGFENRIVVLQRDTGATASRGTLSLLGTVDQDVDEVNGLSGVSQLAVSADGVHVYASSPVSSSVAWFIRDQQTGGLSFAGLRGDSVGLGGATGLLLDPDLNQLFVAGTGAGGIVLFERQADSFCPATGTGQLVNVPFNIGAGGRVTFTIQVEVAGNASGSVENIAILDAARDRDNPSQSSAQSNVVSAEADLAISKSDGLSEIDGLAGAVSIAATGNYVYTAAPTDNAIGIFARTVNPGAADHGDLAFVAAARSGVSGVEGLGGVLDIALSTDRAHLYAASPVDSSIASFGRNLATGRLNFLELEQNGLLGVSGLSGARAVALSPDDRHLYAVGGFANAIASFRRDADVASPGYGQLEFLEVDQNGVGGTSGIGEPMALAVSPDGRNVYVLGAESDTLAVFTRNRTAASGNFGRLEYASHLTNNVAGVAGLGGVRDLVVSADGAFVYVLGAETGTLARFARDPSTGALAFVDFKQDGTAGTSGLAGAGSLLLDDAAGVLYVAGAAAEAIVRFAIDPDSGALDFIDRVNNGDPAPLISGDVFGLEGVSALALPIDGDHLYATSAGRDAVLGFALPADGSVPGFRQILIDGLGGVAPGTLVEYVITVENFGPSDVAQARVVDNFPPEFEAVQWTCSPLQGSGAQCLSGGNGDLDTLVNLPVGGRLTIRATGIIVAGATGRLVNTATVSAIGVTDPVQGNNSATDSDTVLSPEADLVVSVDKGTETSIPGGRSDYIVEVVNAGPSSVRGVFIEDQIPPALFDVAWSCTAEPPAGALAAPLEVASILTPNALAISADGRFAVAVGGDQLEVFRRDPLTGDLLQPSQVLSQGTEANGIRNAQDVVIRADGRFVYVAGADSDAIALFERDAATGELEFVARWQDGLGGIEGLGGIRKLLLSPEGGYLYAASGLDNALAIFAINATTGALTQTGLLVQGVAGVDGLNDLTDLAWVDGGRWLATTADANQALALFRRQPDGGLMMEDVLLNDDLLATAAADALLGAAALIANGNELLVAARDSDRIGRFLVEPAEVATDPAVLVPIGAIDAVDIPALEAPQALAWDPDQARLYVVDALGLQLLSLLDESPLRVESKLHPDFDVLTAAAGLTLSPDLRHLYSFAADAAPSIGVWARERGSRCPLNGERELGRQQVDIVAGGRLVYQVGGTIQANASGTLVYAVEAINPIAGQELNPGNNLGTDTDNLQPAPDLSVTKTLNTATVVAGLSIEWQIDVGNAGLSDADAALVLDPLPVYPDDGSGILAGSGSWSCSANPPLQLLGAQTPGEVLQALTLDEAGQRLYAVGGDALLIFPLLADGTPGAAEILIDGQELPGGTIEGMTGVRDVAVSRDGLSVYVAAAGGDSLVLFGRETLTEPLDYLGSFTTTVPVSGDSVAGLRGARAVTVSDDQRWVFVAGATSNAIAVFERDLRTGALEFVERVADGIGTIVPEFNVIRGASDVHAALDGTLYAIGANSRALSRFSVSDQTGSLGFEQVWRATDLGLADLNGLRGLASAPGDTHLYALTDGGVLRFSRLDGGGLQFDGRYEGLPEPAGTRALVVDASGSRAYVLAQTAAGSQVHVLKRNWIDGSLELWFSQAVNGTQPTALAQSPVTARLHVAGDSDVLASFAELALSRCRLPALVDDGIDSELDLGATGDASFGLAAVVDPAARGEIVNTVAVEPATGVDPLLDNNSASVGAPITVVSDIAVTKTGPVQAVAGSVIDYQITVTNAGPSDALGIIVNELAPSTLSNLSWTCAASAGSTCPAAGSGAPAFAADVRVGGQLDITLQATIDPGLLGQLINVVLLTPEPDATDPTPLNQRAEWITNVVLRPDVAVTKTNLTDPVVAGLPIEYVLEAVNNGLSDAPAVRLTDLLPAALLNATWTCTASAGTSCPATGAGSIDLTTAMDAGSSLQFLVSAQVSPAATANLLNRFGAEVLAPALDPDTSNNLAETLDPVLVRPDIRIELQAPLNPFDPAGPVALPLLATIVNDGPSNARNVELLIDFDAPVTQTEPGCTQPSPTRVRCLVSQLNPDQVRSIPLRLTGVPPAPGQLAVDAAITTTGNDPDLSNNSAAVVIDLVTGIDLLVSVGNGFDWVSPDQVLEYLIRIDNYGSVAASFVDIDIPVPAELLEAEWTCQATGGASCTAVGSGDIVDTVSVPRGGALSYRLTVRVDPTLDLNVPQSVTLVADIPTAPPTDDINPLNNVAVDQDEVRLVMFSDGFESDVRVPATEANVDGCFELDLDLDALSKSPPGRLLEGRADGGELLFWLDRSARPDSAWLRLAGIGRDGLVDSGWQPAGRDHARLRIDDLVLELFDRQASIWRSSAPLAAPPAILRRPELEASFAPSRESVSINTCAGVSAGGIHGVSR